MKKIRKGSKGGGRRCEKDQGEKKEEGEEDQGKGGRRIGKIKGDEEGRRKQRRGKAI